jgi:hypothetical protein
MRERVPRTGITALISLTSGAIAGLQLWDHLQQKVGYRRPTSKHIYFEDIPSMTTRSTLTPAWPDACWIPLNDGF